MDDLAACPKSLTAFMTSMPIPAEPPKSSVAVIGGGVAGLAAAVAAVERGFHVELFEQAPAPGGRAGSYHDTKAGHLVDLSPHVAMGCCTNLLDLCSRTEIADAFDRYATLHFIGPDGTRYDFVPSRWLPAPLHLMPALGRLGYFSGRQRRAIGRAMLRLARAQTPDAAGAPSMGDWLRRQKQPQECVRYFWALVLESALGDSLDHVSLSAARKVFVDGFLAARESYEVLVSRVPLGELWQRVCAWLARRGAKIHMRARIERLDVTCGSSAGVPASKGTAPFLPTQKSGQSPTASQDAENRDARSLLPVYQTKTIISAAMFEGLGFFGTIAYLVEGNPISLGLAVLMILGVAGHFPTPGRIVGWVERQLEAIEVERMTP
jgi:hypothetical protein